METKILGIAGRAGAGKDSLCNMIHSAIISSITIGESETDLEYLAKVSLNDEGRILVQTDESVMSDGYGILDLDNRDPAFVEFMQNYVWRFVKKIGLAESLKEFTTDTLGLDWYDLNSKEGKEKITRYTWKNLPGKPPKGVSINDFVTVRQVLQVYGEYFRGLVPNFWEDNWWTKTQNSESELVIVPDVRHVNSVQYIQDRGGKVIYLPRNVTNMDHSSETTFKDLSIFDHVLQSDGSMFDNHKEAFEKLCEWGFLDAE